MGIPGKSDDEEIFFGFNYKESYLKLIRFMQIRKSYADFLLNKEINYFPCDFPSGLILLFNKSFFQKIGYFDEELFFSGDETDFAIRVSKNKEARVFVSINSFDLVDHVSFGTSGNSMVKNKNYIRGYVYILLKHTDKILSLRYWIRITYYVLSIIYARPHYALHLIYFTFFYTFKFRELKNK
jgi:GT2 family glycosyltransferase